MPHEVTHEYIYADSNMQNVVLILNEIETINNLERECYSATPERTSLQVSRVVPMTPLCETAGSQAVCIRPFNAAGSFIAAGQRASQLRLRRRQEAWICGRAFRTSAPPPKMEMRGGARPPPADPRRGH